MFLISFIPLEPSRKKCLSMLLLRNTKEKMDKMPDELTESVKKFVAKVLKMATETKTAQLDEDARSKSITKSFKVSSDEAV